MKKLLQAINWAFDRCLLLIFITCFFVGIYGLYDSLQIYNNATDESLLYYKPGSNTEKEPEKEITGNMVAWLTIGGTDIDYPVMQGIDNFEYLDKDPYGDFSLSGSVFLDARNSPDFSDAYSLIYGHHMEGGLMFGALDNYLDESFFHGHQEITLTVQKETFNLKAYAVLETDATERSIFAPTETPVGKTAQFVKANSLYYNSSNEPSTGDRILALSTCKYPDTAERTVIFCAFKTT